MFVSDLIVRSAKAAFVSLIVEYIPTPAPAQIFLNSPANSVPRSTQIFFGRFRFVIIFENASRVSFEPFVFIPRSSIVLSNMSCRTSKYLIPLLFLANLSTNAESMHHISFLNLAKAFSHRNLQVGRENFVYDVFECRKCRTFESGILLAFAKFFTEP